ncbi:hypothetical protein [Solidesulfovibrio magneticus]|uniref:DUF5666 domain-containing protein n=1 Tax=Solidesulfovibrio magneticus (strain ATCC 700980 / DSM 13731 / RS-1) TaxID=573370 RepID=C4XGL7_SOLM1|nr:hypothetical protein [Solidesulfovibrio magneticus]BAH73797.1 hypothetical protein DMR_03060 [Solidesulfovibrio magneticus RS-1]
MRQHRYYLGLMAAVLLVCLMVLAAGSAGAAKADDDGKPLKTGVTITGIVEDDYTDGLLVTTEDGTSYMVLTPEEVSLEQEEAFHKKFKGQSVTLTGNVFRDEDGSLSLFVMNLPAQ